MRQEDRAGAGGASSADAGSASRPDAGSASRTDAGSASRADAGGAAAPGDATVIHRPDGAGDGATVLVLLHGRGSDELDLQGLRGGLPADWVVVTPRATHAGAPWGYGPGWAWYRYVEEDRVAPETLEAALADVDVLLEGLPGRLGLTPGRLVLGGFSQGGTTSLSWALTRPGRVDGVLVFSGFLPAPGIVDPTPDGASAQPVFWGHGTRDPAIPHALGERGRERLREAGAPLTARDYPIGHGIAPDELADAVGWVRSLPSRQS